MNMIAIKKTVHFIALSLLLFAGIGVSSCSESQSYSELLREEEKAVNWYLAQHQVLLDLPADSISFETGEDAPFYKLDEDGYIYMQVISKGELNSQGKPADPVASGDLVYFRYSRRNILYLSQGADAPVEGNSEYVLPDATQSVPYNFVYKNTYLTTATTWGTGIQAPLKYLGYNSEVNLVLKSYYGFAQDQTSCIPYIMNVRYFKPEY